MEMQYRTYLGSPSIGMPERSCVFVEHTIEGTALKRDAIAAGYIEPWVPTNAKRSEARKPYRLRRLVTWKSAKPVGQIPLFPELERAAVRLRDFGVGTLPPVTAIELEFRQRQLGLSQRKLGELIGVSRRPCERRRPSLRPVPRNCHAPKACRGCFRGRVPSRGSLQAPTAVPEAHRSFAFPQAFPHGETLPW